MIRCRPRALADGLLREGAVGGEVAEVVFLGGELRELVFEGLTEQLLHGDLVVQSGLDVTARGGDERGAEVDGLVMVRHGVFDVVDAGVRGVADLVLHAPVKEVAIVGVAVPSGGAH